MSLSTAADAPSVIPARSVRIIDEDETILHLRLSQEELLLKHLGCGSSAHVKVLAIFGNTGDGKSHTLNHAIFGGREVFRTSDQQDSCTMGVWLAYSSELDLWCIDTEGLLGTTACANGVPCSFPTAAIRLQRRFAPHSW
jgi:zinc finger FYVE domain-containing protein 1